MAQKLTTSVATMVETAKAGIEEVAVDAAIAEMDNEGVLIVDIRYIR